MGHSQNAPLALLWKRVREQCCFEFDRISSKLYFLSCANLIISCLWSLTIHSTYSDFTKFHHVIHSSGLPPLQLQHLDISLTGDFIDDPLKDQQQLMDSVDIPHLQEITLIGLDFIWLELPHNKLIHFTLANLINPPSLSQLLVFLSNCPVLQVLDLAFQDKNDQTKTTFPITTLTTPLTINKLVLNLTTLRLGAWGRSSYDFVQKFSEHIWILKVLSQFELNCNAYNCESTDRHSIFEAVPSGILLHFSNQEYLNIALTQYGGWLEICAHATTSNLPHKPSQSCLPCPLNIHYQGIFFDESAVLEPIQNMPRIKHLTLRLQAWTIFTS